ncbi:MAG TPA: phospholipase D family protein [Casimicrobiaceae bacterium]
MPISLSLQSILVRLATASWAMLVLAGCGVVPQRMDTPVAVATKPAIDSPLVKMVQVSTPSPELTGFRLMPLAAYSLDARVELIRRAQYSLDIQYYLIANDRTGRLLLRNVRDAANRGVRVRVLVDDLYTSGADSMFIGLSAFPNVEVRLFNPFCCGRESLLAKYTTSLFDFRRVNHRMHNKLFIADAAMVVAGGRNIADEYFTRSMSGNFVDMDAFIVGAVVPQLENIFDAYWNSAHAYPVGQIVATSRSREQLQNEFNALVDEGDQMMEVAMPPTDILGYGPITDDLEAGRLGLEWGKATAFADSPDKVTAMTPEAARSMSVTMNVFDLVMAAKSEVVLSSPYFVPGTMGVQGFAALRQRGVKVTVLTNSLASNDEPLVHTGYARYRPALLRSGVDLYELSPIRVLQNKRLDLAVPGASLGRLHAKTAVIDQSMVFIGSMNLDPRSDSTNTELGVIINSPEFAREVLRVIHISKLQSAYRLQFAADGQSLEWLTTDDTGEVILYSEPDTTLLLRLQNMLLSAFVPEQEL